MAEEKVKTAREKEIADRGKQIELIEAQKIAEKEAIGIQIAAEAEKKASSDKAEAVRIEADGDSQKIKIIAQGEAEAEKLKAEAAEVRYKVEAEGTRAINEASNILSAEQIAMQIKIKLIENLDRIIRESVRPMEAIEGIKILQLEGLNNIGSNAGAPTHGQGDSVGGNLADQVVNSALKYRAQAPLVDSLLKEVGLDGKDINSIKGALGNIFDEKSTPAKASENPEDKNSSKNLS